MNSLSLTSENKLNDSTGDQQIWSHPDFLSHQCQDLGQRRETSKAKVGEGEGLFDVKKEGEVFAGLTTKKHFCENGCWLTRSLFLPFTLHGSEDLKTDSCSQRV